jgi:hypothetical protein
MKNNISSRGKGGKKFSYIIKSNFFGDRVEKTIRFQSYKRGRKDEQVERLHHKGSSTCDGKHGCNNLKESCHLGRPNNYTIVHHA